MLSGRAVGLILGVVFLLIVGTLLGNTQLFVMAAALSCLLLASVGLVLRGAKSVRAQMEFPDLVCVGQPFDVSVVIGGAGHMWEGRYSVDLNVGPGLEYEDEPPPTEHGQTAHITKKMVAQYRGVHKIGPVLVYMQDPLGLITGAVHPGADVEILAWPEPLDPGATVRDIATGGDLGSREIATRAEDGTSIHGVRQWAPGDMLRHVHWPSTTRLGKLAVIEFEDEALEDILMVLDTRILPRDIDGEAFEAACSYVSYMLHDFWARRKRVSLVTQPGQVLSPSSPGGTTREEMLGQLARAEPTRSVKLETILSEAVSVVRPGVVALVTPCWDNEAQDALNAFCGARLGGLVLWPVVGPDGGRSKRLETAGGYCSVYRIAVQRGTTARAV